MVVSGGHGNENSEENILLMPYHLFSFVDPLFIHLQINSKLMYPMCSIL